MSRVDPLHFVSAPGVRWSTRNFSEAMPGVPTALSWTLWDNATRRAAWFLYSRTGIYSAGEINRLKADGVTPSALFYGRCAGCLDLMTTAVARTPGQDPAAFERDMFGITDTSGAPSSTRKRFPVLVTKGAVATSRVSAWVRARCAETDTWWPAAVAKASTADEDAARSLLAEAREQFAYVMEVHGFQTSLAQAAYAKLAVACAERGHPGLERRLVSGHGQLEEVRLVRDLWDLAHDDLKLELFLDRHGYHGPAEGELSSCSWREEPAPLLAAARGYADRDASTAPDEIQRRQRADRALATEQLLAGASPRKRRMLEKRIATTAERMVLRELGKSGFLKAIDAARASARRLGTLLAARGVLEDGNDIYHFTFDEVMDPTVSDDRELVAERRATRTRYEALEVPAFWVGNPEPVEIDLDPSPDMNRELVGLGVSSGVAEGRARVILDPALCDEPVASNEILVAHTTDPSWVALFMSAGGMVVDVGGAMSHAAIVARELGVPCVINAGAATRQIPDGSLIRIDGEAGVVTILKLPGEL